MSRGGRNTKVHAVCDGYGRPLTFLLTGGNAADAPQALALLQAVPEGAIVMADKAYDANAIRRFIESRSAVPNIPFKAKPPLEGLLQPLPLSRAQRHRAHVLPAQGLPAYRHKIRQARGKLPRIRSDRGAHRILVMSPDPSAS